MVLLTIGIALLTGGALAFVLSPLLRETEAPGQLPDLVNGRSAGDPTPADTQSSRRNELMARRDAIYAALKEAEFDRQLDNLGDEEYQDVRARYMHEAADVLRQLDHLIPEAGAAVDAEIEEAVAAIRAKAPGPGETVSGQAVSADAVEAEIASLIEHSTVSGKPQALACPDCGRACNPGDTFCVHCGASLSSTCPACGAPRRGDDAFCARCGAPLRAAPDSQ